MKHAIEGKNFAGDATWIHLNNKVEINLEEEDRSEMHLIKKWIPSVRHANCMEVGSFPGNNLPMLAKLGYTLSGIDISPRNSSDLPTVLKAKGFQVGEFITADFFEYKSPRQYDLVCSFGFIEHFENFLDVIDLHANLVKEGGYLVVTAPNYRGALQYMVHYLFDRSNMKMHNIKSMNPALWAKHLQVSGFEILFQGYFGGLSFWLGNKGRNKLEKFLIYMIHGSANALRKIIKGDAAAFSYNCGIVARKKLNK